MLSSLRDWRKNVLTERSSALINTSSALLVLASLAGYFWFLLSYPNLGKGDTIKATYMLQIFPFLALGGAQLLEWLRTRRPRLWGACLIYLGVVVLFASPLYFSQYTWSYGSDADDEIVATES